MRRTRPFSAGLKAFSVKAHHVLPMRRQAHVLTDGLAGVESRMTCIVGAYRKAVREKDFPVDLLELGLKVKIEEARLTTRQ